MIRREETIDSRDSPEPAPHAPVYANRPLDADTLISAPIFPLAVL